MLPDTQFYSENDPEVFDIQTKWIAADWVDIDYVIHVGDLVQHWDNRREWERASSSFSILEKKNIPYGVVAGDHDNGIWAKGETDYSYYDEYFGYERFADTPWYGGSSSTQTNHHSYHLFKSDETPFVILYLSFENSRQIPLEWADSVLSTYADRPAIVVTHSNIFSDGSHSSMGGAIYNSVVKNNKNVRLVVDGHSIGPHHDAVVRTKVQSRIVYEVHQNYQHLDPTGGNGWLRLYTLAPNSKEVSVRTYSPYLNKSAVGDSNEFTLIYDSPFAEPQ